MPENPPAPATVIVVCGASGAGKTRAATALAAHYGLPLGEADDIVLALSAVTTRDQQPELHYWETHPAARAWEPERIADLHMRVAESLRPAFRAVLDDRLAFRRASVFEGDYLTPEMVVGVPGIVAVVLDEPSADQYVANFLAREPDSGIQRHRAEVSAFINARLVEQARRTGALVVPARPWESQLERLDAALHRD